MLVSLCSVTITTYFTFSLLYLLFFCIYIYCPQQSWGKVIFSVACVKNSVHKGGVVPGQAPPGRYTPQQVPPRQVHPWAGTPPTGTPPGKVTPQGPLADTPHRAVHAGRYGQQADGTHPTGMHSWLYIIFT